MLCIYIKPFNYAKCDNHIYIYIPSPPSSCCSSDCQLGGGGGTFTKITYCWYPSPRVKCSETHLPTQGLHSRNEKKKKKKKKSCIYPEVSYIYILYPSVWFGHKCLSNDPPPPPGSKGYLSYSSK